ncbi:MULTISPECIES: ABC transporter ATP-binding protein [unclassified Mesorhizobium]|uniref:ABC transporter ATP-binding protein n=1 Tax=unclassified Mesorhizobium TaxID=325217 RepID=UPI000FE5C7FA|nr:MULTISPECIES: ABC transporter ATP-binding protein [unclassified Mesorhizobium]RWI16227.1 MAG: ABC transporter ATP-binding protein [Mesorhizobium sp.]RWK50279.1 MAG: ABC transporter ATP-binding protein [Mesorhizobium sp.]RWK87631.1 MAG: ABC transporter ATP-binding protein [Mesorhizobium sp.]TIP58677.1 MAG: ABC transporter ATP-binding protein [Mesorhizobium sp.]TIQ16974.1 MAG: ABC transporter ATP-binding protein [Mesorhizobium sp.]
MLRTVAVSAGYGVLPVVSGVDIKVAAGEVVGLLGRNGAGKTTLLRVIAGALRTRGGAVVLGDQDLTHAPAFRRARAGIAHVPQGRGIFNQLTVRQNLEVGTRAARGRGDRAIPADVFDYFPILRERESQVAGTLSGGQQQMLAIGRALCGHPSVLLLDEPSEGIQPNIVQSIAELVPRIARERGIAIILVEQNLDLVLKAADRCLVMEKGRIVHSGAPEAFADETLLKDLLAL